MKILKNINYLLDRKFISVFKINRNSCRLCGHATQVSASAQTSFRHIDLVCNLTGCTEKNVIKVLSEVPQLQLMREEEIVRRYQRIKELNVFEKHARQIVLAVLNPLTVTNRVLSYIELGFYSHRITVSPVQNYVTLTKNSVTRLKEKRYIDRDTDVIGRLADYAKIDPESIPESLNENCSVAEIKMTVHKEMLKKRLGVTDEYVSESHPYMKLIKNRSVRITLKNIDVYEHVLQIPKRRILTTYYMLGMDPEKPIRFVDEIKSIGGVDVLDFVYVFPQIATTSPENARIIIQLFKDYGITEEKMMKVPHILGFSHSTVKERLVEFRSNKYFGCYRKHPRFTQIICVWPNISRGLRIIEENNLKESSISNMSMKKKFDKYVSEGWGKFNGVDLVSFIQGEFDKDPREIRTALKKNNNWYHASIMDLYLNLTFLRNFYSLDEIWSCVLLLFYPHERLKLELQELDSHTSEYTESLKDNSGRIRQRYRLTLLLYYLERTANFTGEGIYLTQANDDDLVVDDPRHKNLDPRYIV